MKNDAIIFDIDGTLWDACPASAKGWNEGLKKLGIEGEVTALQVKNVAGRPQKECIEIILPGLQKTYPYLFEILDVSENEAVKAKGGIIYDGVVEGIKKLAKSHKIFIVSNCTAWYLDLFLNFSGLKPVLSGCDCNGISNLSKGNMLARMKNKFSLKNPVYIGDTASDEEAAGSAEMEFIHVSYGFGKSKGEAKTFDSFSDLTDYFIAGNG